MKVLLLTTHLNIGGVSVYTVNLARGLKDKKVSVWVGSSGGELVGKLTKEGISHVKFDVRTKFEAHPKLAVTFFKLLNFIRKNDIDIVHAQTRVTQVLGYLLSIFSRVNYVSTCHGFFKSERIGRKLFGAWGDSIIAISDSVRMHLIKDFKEKSEKVHLIYNGVDDKFFCGDLNENEKGVLRNNLGFFKSPVVGSVSRLSPVKGLRYLLFAMKDILKEMPEVRLLLVGEGPSKDYLMGLAKKLGIESSVFFALSTTHPQRFLSIIDIFVFYSLEEGLGLSLLEALASGKPCVASNVGGVASVIKDSVTGLLIPPKDTHALKEAIMKIMKNKKLSTLLAKQGKALVKKKFSLDHMTEEVIDVYSKAAKK